jgi:signal transduction histidine kinase
VSWWIAAAGWGAAAAGVLSALRLRQALAVRNEVVARACHEVRGPLAAARLGLSLGQRTGSLSASRLGALDQELERAARAIADLDRSQRGSAKSERAAVDVHGLLSASVMAWEATAEAKGTSLGLRCAGGPVLVRGDRVRLAQAVGNLIANALEHGGGPVELRAGSDGAMARVEVLDAGSGLDAPVSELIRGGRGGGRGRGLAIAAAIAAEHGGRLSSAPSEGGARLVLTLPLAVPQRPARASRI